MTKLLHRYVHVLEMLFTLPCRLVWDEERQWTIDNIDAVGLKHFPNIDRNEALKRPILYSCWLSKDYIPVDQEELREYVKARLKASKEFLTQVNVLLASNW